MFFAPGEPPLPTEESNYYWKVVWDLLEEAQRYAADHRDEISEETSFWEWLNHSYLNSKQSLHPERVQDYMSERLKQAIRGLVLYWADENAIPIENVSMKYMDAEEIFPGDHCLVTNGFDRVVKVLMSQLNKDATTVLMDHAVDKIEYTESEVRVSTNKGTFTADQVLVTLPLGVLKVHSASPTFFSPPLPTTKQHAINHLGFGTMFKIFLFFPTCFWPDKFHFINFLPSHLTRQPNPVLISRFHLSPQQQEALTVYMQDLANYSSLMHVYQLPILIGYATNRAAELMERLTDEEARMVYLCQLAHYFDILVSDKQGEGETLWPKVSFMSRWNQDPFAYGSYTSIPVGARPDDIETFEVPVGARRKKNVSKQIVDKNNHANDDDDDDDDDDNYHGGSLESVEWVSVDDPESGRVFFAGEHTSSGHFASIQGALMSGRREAAKILSFRAE
ncbi:putative lysine-specific histone demethylase 1 [Modicella reniformis]|uniref:Lysine-specific histone demethylase 1 n=1 Tax=Modicella reniformis TaxID=1440133 RepID=A0A9P6IND1_9FUNG|nr:putative lysine-specific histone demethylase 1 [Modicella reniformis]